MNDRSSSDIPPSDDASKYNAPKYIALKASAPKVRSADSPVLTRWQKVLALYREKPLLYGFFTLLAATILITGLSSLLSPEDAEYGIFGGRRGAESQDATARFVVGSLRRLDEYNHFQYTETLRNSLNQWMVEQNLSKHEFTLEDARIVQGAAWMRDISNQLRRKIAATHELGEVDDLKLAEALFDWTMRNVTLYERDDNKWPDWELAWESLLWGRAKVNSRAWIFIELCRQQRLDVAMLHYRDPDDPGDEKAPNYKLWIPALLLKKRDEEPKLYLFDHKLGLPIPGPKGQGIATLSQVMRRPEILRQLDIERYQYPVRTSELKDLIVSLDDLPNFDAENRRKQPPAPSPWADRMEQLERDLREREPPSSDAKIVLTIGLERLRQRFSEHKHLLPNPDPKEKGKPELIPEQKVFSWLWPRYCLAKYHFQEQAGERPIRTRLQMFGLPGFEQKGQKNIKILEEYLKSEELFQGQPVSDPKKQKVLASVAHRQREKTVPGFLWKARMLQFKGIFQDITDDTVDFKRGAANVYQTGRVSNSELDQFRARLLKDEKSTQEDIKKARKNDLDQELIQLQLNLLMLQNELRGLPVFRFYRTIAHIHASYWIGIVAYERGDYHQAVEYFRQFRRRDLKNLPQIQKGLVGPIKKYAEALVKDWEPVWTNGARYNLARSLEAEGRHVEALAKSLEAEAKSLKASARSVEAKARSQEAAARSLEAVERYAEAIEIFQSDVSRQSHGSLLRARLLQKKLDRLKE